MHEVQLALQAVAIVGLVILVHVSPIAIKLPCGFCTCFWVSLAWYGVTYGASYETAVGMGTTAVVGWWAAMNSGFRTAVEQPLEAEQEP